MALIAEVFHLRRNVVNVFYSPSRMSWSWNDFGEIKFFKK